MNRAGCFRRAVAAYPARKGKLLEKPPQAFFVLAFVCVNFGVGTLQIDGSQNTRGAVPRSGQKNHVQVILFDEAIQVDVSKSQTGTCTPVSQKPIFDVLYLQRLFQEWIILQVD